MNILITGMSGAGKSSAVAELIRRGFDAIDTDTDEWCEWISDGLQPDWIWREEKMRQLLSGPRNGPLFLAGCKTNQGAFYAMFDHVVLLTAPSEILLERVRYRSDNPYGKSAAQRAEILHYVCTVEPLLRAGATLALDTSTLNIVAVVDCLVGLAHA